MKEISMPAPLEWPKILTNDDWQKQKGIIAKIVKDTNVTNLGAEMTKAKSVYDQIDWMTLSALTTYKNETELNQAKAAAMNAGKKFEEVRQAVFKLRDHATGVQTKFKASKLIPKSSTEHVGKIIAACENFALQCKSIGGPIMAKFDEAEKRMLSNRAVALKIVKDQVAKVQGCINGVLKNPTSDNYDKTCWQPVRAFAAGVAKAPPLAPFQPEWKVLSSITPGNLKDGGPVKTHAEKLNSLLSKTASACG
jgi:hypothetical protein